MLATRTALGTGFVGLVILALGLAGLLTRASAISVLGAGLLLLIWKYRNNSATSVRNWLTTRSTRTLITILFAFPTGIAIVAASIYPGLMWKPLDPHPYDVMSYHLQVPREWFHAGRIIPLHHNVFGFFPMGVETHYLLAMHLLGGPWAGMYLCQLMSVAFGGLTALAVAGSVRQFGGGRSMAWLAALTTLCVPWTTMLSGVCYVESAVMLYTLLAVTWASIALTQTKTQWRPMALAGLLAGFAGGAKYTAVAMTLVPLAILWPIFAWRTRGRHLFRPWLTAIICGGIVLSPWLIRNWAWAGNPVFPLAMHTFGTGQFTPDQVDRFDRAHAPPPGESTLLARLSGAGRNIFLDGHFGYVFVGLAIVASTSLLIRRRHLLPVAALAAMAVIWLTATHDQPRFLTPAIPLAAVLIALAIPPNRVSQWPAAAILLIQCGVGLTWTWTAMQPNLGYARAGFFRLPGPALLDSPELAAAKAAGVKVALIGDAQAFGQEIGPGKLRYRGVFDLAIPPGVSTADGWLGEPVEQLRREGYWVIVDTAELARLSSTYAHIPPPAPPYDDPHGLPIQLPPLP